MKSGEVWGSWGKSEEVWGDSGGSMVTLSGWEPSHLFRTCSVGWCEVSSEVFRVGGRRRQKAERKESQSGREAVGGSERDGSASIFTARPSCSSRGAAAGDCATPEVCVIAAHFDELNRLFTHPPHVSSFPLLVPDLFNLGDVVSL